jgi:peptidoglycan-associated lipoprotein
MKKWLASLCMLGLIAGCASQGTTQPPASVEDRSAPSGSEPTVTPLTGTPITGNSIANPLTDPGSPLSKRSVYFDFDSSSVKDEFKPLLSAHAQYLTDNRSAKVTIRGNTDERGSREYNLALGQRRADSIKQVLVLSGASESQVETVSLGEEKPRATGDDEAAYAENRRGDIVYSGEQ